MRPRLRCMTVAPTKPTTVPGGSVIQFVETWGRTVLTFVVLLAQIVLFGVFVLALVRATGVAIVVSVVLAIVVLLWLVNRRIPMSYKLAWAVPIMLLPIVGPAFYVTFGTEFQTPRQRREFKAATTAARLALESSGTKSAADLPPHARRQAEFLANLAHQPPTDGRTAYFPTGEAGFDEVLRAIAGAERYVLCSSFMVARGVMFERLFAALAERAQAGVEVRILYDDFGSLLRRPKLLARRCAEVGIKVHAVHPLGLGLSLSYNNRDHRKVVIVDGVTALTGGINYGDEYINQISPYGYWKDNVVRVDGPAAWPSAISFLTQWRITTREVLELERYRPTPEAQAAALGPGDRSDKFAVPFDDNPFDADHTCMVAYINAIAGAARTIDILTPYLVLDDPMAETIRTAAQSGIRVRVVCPGTNDGWAVGHVSRANYKTLVAAGVEVYEYQPGFLHSKVLLADDDIGIVGTVNLDYRSFYLHHENGLWLYQADCLPAVRADVAGILAVSRRITAEEIAGLPVRIRLLRSLLRPLSALL